MMQIDELRGGLAGLADAMEPFETNVRALHQRDRRRRIITRSLAAVVVVALGVGTVAIARRDGSGRVQVEGAGAKEVPAAHIDRVDIIVVPATTSVRSALDTSPFVEQYAVVPRAMRGPRSSTLVLPFNAFCALETSDGYAVQLSTTDAAPRAALVQSLRSVATVFDVSADLRTDAEVFLKIGASSDAVAALRAQITADPAVGSFTFVTQADAYQTFKHDFENQPGLLQDTKPSDLPESFRLELRSGASVAATVARYEHRPGVDTIINRRAAVQTWLFDPAKIPVPRTQSAC